MQAMRLRTKTMHLFEKELGDLDLVLVNGNGGAGQDPTHGATHYFDVSLDNNPPPWTKELSLRITIGRLHFYGPH